MPIKVQDMNLIYEGLDEKFIKRLTDSKSNFLLVPKNSYIYNSFLFYL